MYKRQSKDNGDDDDDTDASPGIRGMLDAAAPASDDDNNNASPGIRGMLNAAAPAPGLSRPEPSMRFCPHPGRCAQGSRIPHGEQSIASYVRPLLCVCARWTPVRRSRFSVDGGRVATPGSAPLLQAGTIRGDRTCRIFRSASSRSGSVRKPVERYSEASMFRTYEPPELILPISYGEIWCELAGWPRQLRSLTGEV